jgi:peptidoglycan hydrolase CwlO-like protein
MAKEMSTDEVLRSHRESLEKKLEDLLKKNKPLYDEREKLLAEINERNDKVAELMTKIRAADGPVANLRNEISKVAKAAGGRSMSNPVVAEQ